MEKQKPLNFHQKLRNKNNGNAKKKELIESEFKQRKQNRVALSINSPVEKNKKLKNNGDLVKPKSSKEGKEFGSRSREAKQNKSGVEKIKSTIRKSLPSTNTTNDDKTLVCPYCQFISSWKYNLKNHIKKCHPDKKLYQHLSKQKLAKMTKCSYCDDYFDNPKLHIRQAHPEKFNSEWHCFYCQKKLSQKYSIYRHIKMCHPGKPLLQELSKKELARFKCLHCNIYFINFRGLNIHTGRIHPEKFNSEFYCLYCQKTFSTKHKLERHSEKSHPDKPLNQEHQGKYKVICPHCQLSVPRKYDLNRHIESLHPEVYFEEQNRKKNKRKEKSVFVDKKNKRFDRINGKKSTGDNKDENQDKDEFRNSENETECGEESSCCQEKSFKQNYSRSDDESECDENCECRNGNATNQENQSNRELLDDDSQCDENCECRNGNATNQENQSNRELDDDSQCDENCECRNGNATNQENPNDPESESDKNCLCFRERFRNQNFSKSDNEAECDENCTCRNGNVSSPENQSSRELEDDSQCDENCTCRNRECN